MASVTRRLAVSISSVILTSAFVFLSCSCAPQRDGDPGYIDIAKREFAAPRRIVLLQKLYADIEEDRIPFAELIAVNEMVKSGYRVWKVPQKRIPKDFNSWGVSDNHSTPEWRDVLAYFDADRKLVAVEFLGSRYGCYLSKIPDMCPANFSSLHRVSESPLFITVVIQEKAPK
jgi:hypothetical protein